MPDTTTDATTTPTPEAVGEMLGSALAGIVILNLRAADTGWERGWLYEHALTHPATYPTPPGCVVPEPFTRFDAHAATYRDAWFAGRDDYRADHNLPPLPGRQA